MADLKRRVESQPWGKSGWLPELKVIRWDALDAHREQHEAAVAAVGAASSDRQVAATVRDLCDAVEAAVIDLRKRCGFTFGVASRGNPENEFASIYGRLRDEIEHQVGGRAPVGHDSIAEWAERTGAAPELHEAALRRMDLREDYDAWFEFQQVTLNGASRLVGGSIVPLPAAEAAAIRQELQIGAAA